MSASSHRIDFTIGSDTTCAIAMWVYPTANNSSSYLFAHGTDRPRILRTTTGNIDVLWNFNGTNAAYITNDTPLATLNKWYFVVIVLDVGSGQDIAVYTADEATWNGESTYGTSTNGTSGAKISTTFTVGNRAGGAKYFRGRIAKVAHFPAALNEGDLIRHWRRLRSRGSSSTNLLIELGIRDALGTQRDFSGNDNDGTVTGCAVADHVPRPSIFTQLIPQARKSGGGTTITPDPAVLSLNVPDPTIVFGTKTITPGPVALNLVVPDPTIVIGAKTVTPDPVVLNLNVPDPTVQLGALAITPDPAVLNLNVPDPTVGIGVLAVTPDPAVLDLNVPDVSIGGLGGTTITPDPAVLSLVVPSPSIDMTLTISPDPAALNLNVPDPTLGFGAISITPDPATLNLAVPDVWVGFAPITPDPVVLNLVVPDPTLGFTTLPDGYEFYVGAGNAVDLDEITAPADDSTPAPATTHDIAPSEFSASALHFVSVVPTNAAGRSLEAAGFYIRTNDAAVPILAPPPVERLTVKPLAGGKALVAFDYSQASWLTVADHFVVSVTVIDAPGGSYLPVQVQHTPPSGHYELELTLVPAGLFEIDVVAVSAAGEKFENVRKAKVYTKATGPSVTAVPLSVVG